METVTDIRDSPGRGSTLQPESSSLGSGEVEPMVEGGMQDSQVQDEESAECGVEESTADLEEPVGREADSETVTSMNETSDNNDMDTKPRKSDVRLTMKLGDSVEDDARAVARSLTSLLSSLKSALSEVTGSSVEHMHTENEAAGQVQDAAIDAATKGNRFINACLRLNEEMKGMKHVTAQLELLKQKVDQFEYQATQYLPRH